MILGRVFNCQSISFDFASTDKRDVIQELAQKLVVSQPSLNYDKVLSALLQRESKLSTGIGRGVAIPHALCEGVEGVHGVIGISRQGIDFESLDNEPVHLVFMLVSGVKDCDFHLQVIKRLASLLQNPDFLKKILATTNAQDAYNCILEFERLVIQQV